MDYMKDHKVVEEKNADSIVFSFKNHWEESICE